MKGLCKDLKQLKPEFLPIVEWIISQAKIVYKTNLVINETMRYDTVQIAYYAQGRETLDKVNALRKDAGLYVISEAENKNIITNVQHVSEKAGHGSGLAIDMVPGGDWKSDKWDIIGKCVLEANIYFREVLQKLNAVIIWGGNFKNLKDNPHIELQYNKEA